MNSFRNTSITIQWVAVLLFLLSGTILNGQNLEKVQLLDQATLDPIIGATFEYTSQSGISDEDGYIEFRYADGETMSFSHINYGQWQAADNEVRKAIQNNAFYREDETVMLYPVTIIAMRPKTDESESLDLDYTDLMAHDGGAILNRTPVINGIRKGGGYGYDPVLRGFKYDQLSVVLNGAQSATAACPNRMDPPTSQMAPNMMERIEILKGPHALRYGSAFGGTINFVPAAHRFTDEPDTYGRFSGGYEENGDVLRSEGLLGFSGKKYDLGLLASWSQGNDYRAGDGTTVQSDFLRGSFGAKLGLKIAENQELSLSATRNLARDADFPALPMDLRVDDTWMLNARHDITLNRKSLKSWNTTAYGSFVNHVMNNYLKPLAPRIVNAETDANTQTYGARTEGVWKFPTSSLFAGADLHVEQAEGIRTREFLMGPNEGKILTDNAWQNSKISKTSLFAEYHLRRNSLQFVFSGRLELNDATTLEPDKDFEDLYPETGATQINPSISIGGIKNFDNDFSMGLWLGRAQRSGSLTERYINYFPVGLDPYEMLGNPQINPEVNNQVDLTFQYKKENMTINVDVFAAYLQDYISSVIDTSLSPVIPTSPGVRRYINIDQAFKTGVEVSWNQYLFAGLQHQLSLAYTYGQDLEREEPLPEIAPLDMRYRLSGSYLKNKLRPEVALRQVIKQDRISSEFGETATPAFTILDVSVAYQFNKIFSLSTGVQNIFDQAYYEHLNRSVKGADPRPIYAPGRNFFVTFNVSFM